MKPSGRQPTTQARLALEADESRIWETLEATQQRQLTEHLARLWMQYVIARQQAVQPNVATSLSSLHKA